jgi:ADP-ribosylglycohydrolase
MTAVDAAPDDGVLDRAIGVLMGLACGDALGVPYEFDRVRLAPDEQPAMLGGGLGDFEPGEWSDDTSMAIAVAEGLGAATDPDEQLDGVARRFLDWFRTCPPDVGVQTRAVLSSVADAPEAGLAIAMASAADTYARQHPHTAGNGALMRTAPIALAHLDDREACAEAARAVAALTHAGPEVADSCVLWTEAVRVALQGGGIDVESGLDLLEDDDRWRDLLEEATTGDLERFHPNGWTVRTLQIAYGAIHRAHGSLEDALATAIRVGDDTDTVAAVAGALLGAHHGASALPASWVEAIHGWPGYTASDLRRLALTLLAG